MISRHVLSSVLVIASVLFAAAPAPAQSCQDRGWLEQISPRNGHAMAYDSARGVTVLFGGDLSYYNLTGETWEWDGDTWTLRATSGPTARVAHAMAYDSARGVTVLFGGYSGAGN